MSKQRKSLLTGASVLAAAAAAMAASPALAQNNTSSGAAASSSGDEAIVVTGTRLVRQDFEAISPVTTVGAEQIQLTGTLNTETLLNDLPQVAGGNTITSNNVGGEDFSTVDLRGLGPSRTLVLVNGERVPASSTTGVVDVSTIPAGLISRVEIVSGGASAVYGSDAMAGVVNFVLKDDYEGAEINATYGSELSTGNVPQFDANILLGGNFANGRGNMTLYADYYNRDGVFQSAYDYSRTAGAVCQGADGSHFICDSNSEANAVIAAGGSVLGGNFPGGSGTPPWGWITQDPGNPFQNLATALPGQFASANTDCNSATPGVAVNSGNLSFDDQGHLTPRFSAGNTACAVPDRAGGSSRYNFAPVNYLVIPAERINIAANGHYDINDNLRLNYLMSYANNRQVVQLAATPATNLTVTLTPTMRNLISTAHPDLWTALQTRADPYAPFVANYRTTQVGNRIGTNTDNEFYAIFGLDGQLGDNWDWNLSASYGQSEFLARGQNSINATGLAQGLAGCTQNTAGSDGVVGTEDDGETPLAGALPGCQPIDIFGPNHISDAAQAFVRTATFSSTVVEENRVSGYVRGNLFQLPAGPVSTVFGFEYRDTEAAFHVDSQQSLGNIFGFNAVQDRQGAIDVYELYTEFAVPLISEQPFAYYLGLEGGYRISNYSSAGNVETWKLGGEWAPTSWLRFRGVYNVATRAPNVFELFEAGDQGFTGYTDPCNDATGLNPSDPPNDAGDGHPDSGAPAANCTGGAVPLPAGVQLSGFSQVNGQVQVLAFGNTGLAPETADTYTIGMVFQPDWFPVGDLRVTLDYYNIHIDGFIASFSAGTILGSCYGVPDTTAVPDACGKITRDPLTGQVDTVDTSPGNVAQLQQSGWDLQAEWSLPLGPGQLTLNELWSHINEFTVGTTDSLDTINIATGGGEFGGATPDNKSVFSATYALGDWTFLGRWTWAHGPLDSSNAGVLARDADNHVTERVRVPDSSYVDLSARWNVTDNFSVTGVVNNIFDDYPPSFPAAFAGQANTSPTFYRPLGRTFTISGRLRF